MRLAGLLLALAVAGCGYTETHEVVLRAPTGPSPHPVELYVGGRMPERPVYEVALLQVTGHGGDANLEAVTHGLAARASLLGCDAVVRIHVDEGYTMAHGFGVCVRYVAPASL
jgi:hypothetical protein